MEYQKTISNSVKIEGVNVYNGKKNHAVFHPANPDSGVIFYYKGERVKVTLENAIYKNKSIFLRGNKKNIGLVEHLLSSVYVLGLDNLLIELGDGVCPTTNNCAREYFLKLKKNIYEQEFLKEFWKYSSKNPVEIICPGFPDKIKVSSSKNFNLDYYFNYPHVPLRDKSVSFDGDPTVYEKEISNSRPPGFLGNFSNIFLFFGKLGLHGINCRNYLIVGNKKMQNFLNPKKFGVRHKGNEPALHKILDFLGILALTGKSFKETSFDVYMSGHKFDLFALNKLFNEGYFEKVL